MCKGIIDWMAPNSRTSQYSRDRGGQDRQVKCKGLPIDVLEVQLDSLRPSQRISAPNLSQPGESGAACEASSLSLGEALNLKGESWSGPDNAHVTVGDVQQLGQLVK
jgi:hypothetical protein